MNRSQFFSWKYEEGEDKMKSVIVFGGTGSIGKLVVKSLIKMNAQVKIFTRNSPKEEGFEKSTYIVGNVLEYRSVEEAIAVDDTIVISLGFNNSAINTMSKGTENILKAMKAKSCDRVICLSAHGAGESWDDMPDSFKEMVHSDVVLSASFKDHTIQEALLKTSDFDWTIVRPTEVIDALIPGKKYIVNGFSDDLIFQICKYDVADFIASEVVNPKYSKKVAMITC
jgi:nucleoside-diphosphate-sugar epimerase